jgi:ferredoxin
MMTQRAWNGRAEDVIRQRIEAFIAESPHNALTHLDGSPFYSSPLVGYADGDDPLFERYRELIGPTHMTPREWIEAALSEGQDAQHASLERISVVAYVLPVAEAVRASNREQREAPSAQWAHTRNCGEGFNERVCSFVVDMLRQSGYLAIGPLISDLFRTYQEAQPGHAARPPFSNWSERHAQYAAGLGTFSVNDGLITARGIAHRCGSVITNLPLEPTARPYAGPYDYCLLLAEGRCGVCIDRCPAGAISEEGHDKLLCRRYQNENLRSLREALDISISGCGLCQTAVPCEAGIPE